MKSEKPGSPGRADGTNLAADTYLANSSLVGQIAFKQSGMTRMTTPKQYVYLRVAQYTNNTLNQITSRDIPATVDVMGDALATNAVTVNGQTPYRKNEYFRQQLTVTNSSAPVWQSITVSSPGQTSIIGNAYIAKEPETFSYDADGNLTQDGRWAYTWDGENRLISQISLSSAPTTSKFQISYAYDYQGRRIQKVVSTNNGSAYVSDYTRLFVYDGWNLVGEMTSTTSLLRGYFWGSDLSGSLQGAGGVGGLLEVSYRGATTTNGFIAYDVNGNVAAVVNAADGAALANYAYGPFGEVIRATGPMAKLNPLRFSTKYDDDEGDLLYYGYRFYNAYTGRWLNRDPYRETGFDVERGGQFRSGGPISLVAERGNPNHFAFLRNSPVNDYDVLGLCGAPNCQCGGDVTTSVFQTLQDILDTYDNASSFQKFNAQNAMFGPLSFSSWDILYLYNYANPNPTVNGCAQCDTTVTFQGMCVKPNELNYIMYGWGTQVTGYSWPLAFTELAAGLALRGSDNQQAAVDKLAFASFGAHGLTGHVPSFVAQPSCTPNNKQQPVDIHDWRWMGLKWISF